MIRKLKREMEFRKQGVLTERLTWTHDKKGCNKLLHASFDVTDFSKAVVFFFKLWTAMGVVIGCSNV